MKLHSEFPRVKSLKELMTLDWFNQVMGHSKAAEPLRERVLNDQLTGLLQRSKRSPFWRERLATSGLSSKEVFNREDLKKLPILTRDQLQTNFGRLRCYTRDESKEISSQTTTGSTGQPITVERYTDTYSLMYQIGVSLQSRWHQHRQPKLVGVFRHQCEDSDETIVNTGLASQGARVYKRNIYKNSLDALYQTLVDKQPDSISGSPTLIRLFCMHTQDRSDGLRIDTVHTLGESVTAELRALVQDVWGATIIDRYSCGELGLMAIQCPKHPHYHVLGSHVLVELLDDQGNECPVGTPGRVIVTGLHSHAMPLIRYDVGDVAAWGDRCDCGCQWPVLNQILGKTRNLIDLPNGTKHFVSLGGDFGNDIAGLRKRRVVFHRRGEIEMQYVSTKPLKADELALLTNQLQSRFGHPWPVKLMQVENLEDGSLWKRAEFTVVDS